ncbi:MAG: hypothetical protein JXA89_03265 [Anaerolineae bacterium]|nr:hypothetical protein [Anaerolineae bacterium]
MLEAKPKNFFSRDLQILENDRPVARVEFAWSSETGQVTIGDTRYTIRQDPPGYCSFILEDQDHIIAQARGMRTLFQHACAIEHAGKWYQLEDKSRFRRNIIVREGVQFIGYVESKHIFVKQISACLPDHLPLVVKAFIIALVMHLWAHQESVM